jgi:hypothetical protein
MAVACRGKNGMRSEAAGDRAIYAAGVEAVREAAHPVNGASGNGPLMISEVSEMFLAGV